MGLGLESSVRCSAQYDSTLKELGRANLEVLQCRLAALANCTTARRIALPGNVVSNTTDLSTMTTPVIMPWGIPFEDNPPCFLVAWSDTVATDQLYS